VHLLSSHWYESHRWACLLIQQISLNVSRLQTKENKLPLSVLVWSKQTEAVPVFRLQQTNGYICCHFTKKSNGKRKTRRFSLICLLFSHLVICPFVDRETNGSYPFANGVNRLNGTYLSMYATNLNDICLPI
jgi:hypothetical protein